MSGSKNPMISVVMSVYNGERYLRKAVDSILCQSFNDFEFIIINDGSTDRSGEILASFAAKDSRIRIIEVANQGLTKSLNLGLTHCQGRYIARMDADDISLPERFAKQVAFLDEYNETVAIGTGVELIDEDDEPLGTWVRPTTHEALEKAHLSGRSARIVHPSVMMRASAVKEVGGYREELSTGQDYDLFLRLGEIGRIGNLPEVLVRYRQHLGSVCSTRSNEQHEAKCKILREAFLRRGLNLEDMPVPPSFIRPTMEESLVEFANIATRNGNLRVAKKHAVRALRRLPIKHSAWPQMVRVVYGKWIGRIAQRLPRQMILRFSRAPGVGACGTIVMRILTSTKLRRTIEQPRI
jgi:glycosyltransferase involved in cell wall biosynthesis